MTSIQTTQPRANPRLAHPLDEHLDDVAEVLRIDEARRNAAEQAAIELNRWIRKDPFLQLYIPELYPQGSFLIRTTVRPRRDGTDQDEFDLDMVVELSEGWDGSPDDLFERIWLRLQAHPTYGKYAEKKRRCVCINFPGEFHMDVLPARPDEDRRGNGYVTAIQVPDRKLHDWKASDPKGFAAWFETQSKERVWLKLAAAGRGILPEDEEAGLDALRKIVQLTKRHRDVIFNGSDDAPRSIVLTTLLGYQYQGQQSTYEALKLSVGLIADWADAVHGVPEVEKPVNEDENFAEAWDDMTFKVFKSFINNFYQALVALELARGPEQIQKLLAVLFAENVAVSAMKKYSKRQAKAFEQGEARYDPSNKGNITVGSLAAGLLGGGKAVPGGTNFGD